jgi:hypothetical protein
MALRVKQERHTSHRLLYLHAPHASLARPVLPFKSTILRSFLSAESFFFRNEQFFIVMS